MPFAGSNDTLERFLNNARLFSLMIVPVYLIFLFNFTREEGWRWSFLAFCVLPPAGAVAGFLGKRDVRPKLAALALVLAIAPLPLIGALETLF
ncbi:hypothetical protein GCM10010145_00680 [Streptomyces ruber]|uniref:Uncharacterized protein n=2 Tax=Streptomyces TaxID=1883 RepID=A0A918EPP2_9ACTN|nr:hypothetical protein [Streptomyces ruber]GGQ37464.1 hypothetical protein GCM10010145_00680 [Streptomyces ruber]